jgi:ketosteroid isomerase-like protein
MATSSQFSVILRSPSARRIRSAAFIGPAAAMSAASGPRRKPTSLPSPSFAWATFRGRLTGEAGGVAAERRLRFTAILHRTDAGWRLRHLQSTVASQGR